MPRRQVPLPAPVPEVPYALAQCSYPPVNSRPGAFLPPKAQYRFDGQVRLRAVSTGAEAAVNGVVKPLLGIGEAPGAMGPLV